MTMTVTDRDTSPQTTVTYRRSAAAILLATLPLTVAKFAAEPLYPTLLTIVIVAAAAFLAIIDARTLRLPNAPTLALLGVGLTQVVVTLITGAPETAMIAVGASTTLFLITLAAAAFGWVGVGDAKFIAGLTLTVALLAGWYALYLLPVALMIESLRQVISRRTGRNAFGPALAVAATIIMIAALANS